MNVYLISGAFGVARMAIYRRLKDRVFDDQAVRAMAAAYESALIELGLSDRTDPLTEIIAAKIIDQFQATREFDPKQLSAMALKDIRQ